ncbi:SigE family RNA polymerase sigma factor [Micromonospora sp. NBC_01796]|uniref:SigE family RNA polymerase sigma factor n=1 Tax=Micromonospora sp. NBC_01796 TaxID=2975987 RepID=UPI002DDA9A4D|nr:SigE family RNA polymerase sigma factor [Micromonospora sp. NBC_01796]WSA85599.1 SigE family RNA polymerase sigma factor [Micromonospora sp. NBC_01796]
MSDDFVEFARAAAGRLRDTAFLMCRDWHLAQDLTQMTLAKVYASWRRVRAADNPHAYARTILVRLVIDQRRRHSSRETALVVPPEQGVTYPAELRLTLLDALATLPARDRAIVVLRYWEDLSVETVADMLDVSTAVVKTQSMRSLTRLRELLGDSRLELFAEDRRQPLHPVRSHPRSGPASGVG